MNSQLREDFQKFLAQGAYCTPPGKATCALNSARILAEWRIAERAGLVRIVAEEEHDSYADVYGREEYEASKEYIENWGCFCVVSYVADESERDGWRSVDSIGMCVYEDPTSPFENCYVIGLMNAALKQIAQCGEVDAL